MTLQNFAEETADSNIIGSETAFSIRLYEPLRKKLDSHSTQKGISRVAFIQQLLEVVLNLEIPFEGDAIKNLEMMSGIINRTDWQGLRQIETQLKDSPITQRADLQDIVVAMIGKGVSSHNAEKRRR